MKRKIISILLLIIFTNLFYTKTINSENKYIPYYFIAIHNEPFNLNDGSKLIENSYTTLKRMIERADRYSIKLTLMFSAQWADYISKDKNRMELLEKWKKNGHEIAGHHHSIYHTNRDGYTNYPLETAQKERMQKLTNGKGDKNITEKYFGTLKDYISMLKKINPDIKSGCMNAEEDMKEIPEELIYETSSGYAN